MALKTDEEQLEEVQATISEVMTSQELRGPNSHVVRANLEVLWDIQEKLLAKIAQSDASGTGGFLNQVKFTRGT